MKRAPEIIEPEIFGGIPVRSGFTTRNGGVSVKPYDSFNFGFQSGDSRKHVETNHEILYSLLGIEAGASAFMNQVHGSSVAVVNSGGVSKETDGIVSSEKGLLLGVKCADCIPLLLSGKRGTAVAAVHCGWRPLVGGIAERAVRILTELSGGDVSGILAAVGPSAGPCCYEIGTDVADKLHGGSVIDRNGRLYGDLGNELRLRLIGAGLASESIEMLNRCTICNPDSFYSYRRDAGESGRMLGFIMIEN